MEQSGQRISSKGHVAGGTQLLSLCIGAKPSAGKCQRLSHRATVPVAKRGLLAQQNVPLISAPLAADSLSVRHIINHAVDASMSQQNQMCYSILCRKAAPCAWLRCCRTLLCCNTLGNALKAATLSRERRLMPDSLCACCQVDAHTTLGNLLKAQGFAQHVSALVTS